MGINIIGFSSSAFLSERGISCTNAFLCKYLKNKGVVSEIVNVELNKLQKYKNLAENINFEKKLWLFKDRISVKKAHIKSEKASAIIKTVDLNNINVCLQIGSDFTISNIDELKTFKKFSYHDNNICAFLKSKHGLPIAKLSKPINEIINFEKNVYENLDGIFTMTNYLKKSFVEDFNIPERKVHCIGVGCNLSEVKDFEKKYNNNRILFVGKDSFSEKGGHDLIKAFNIVKNEIADVKLIIVGQKIKTDSKDIICTGYIDKRKPGGEEELLNQYRRAGVFVMPSYVEATGNVFLEAMACKVPCIGADVSAMPEIILESGCGLVVKPGDIHDLARKIIYILKNRELQIRYGRNGFQAIKNKYNWDSVCDKAISIMEDRLCSC